MSTLLLFSFHVSIYTYFILNTTVTKVDGLEAILVWDAVIPSSEKVHEIIALHIQARFSNVISLCHLCDVLVGCYDTVCLYIV